MEQVTVAMWGTTRWIVLFSLTPARALEMQQFLEYYAGRPTVLVRGARERQLLCVVRGSAVAITKAEAV